MPTTARPNYGIDAPGLLRTFVLVAVAGAAIAVVAAFGIHKSSAAAIVVASLLVVTAYAAGMAALMLYGSKVYKVRNRERLLDRMTWTGDERVLDVGCGGGLMLVGAARCLTTGRAVGIDLWSAADQDRNRPGTSLENAACENVADRVEIVTGDMRALPFDDASFDAIVSHWAVHNVPDADGRLRSLREMRRVLRPGGVAVIADIAHRDAYAAAFASLGMRVERVPRTLLERFYGIVSFGSFRPSALVARD